MINPYLYSFLFQPTILVHIYSKFYSISFQSCLLFYFYSIVFSLFVPSRSGQHYWIFNSYFNTRPISTASSLQIHSSNQIHFDHNFNTCSSRFYRSSSQYKKLTEEQKNDLSSEHHSRLSRTIISALMPRK